MIYKRTYQEKHIARILKKNAKEGELDDEKVFELIRGEWVEAKDEEEDGKDAITAY